MTLTSAQVQASLAQLQTLKKDVIPLLAYSRQDVTMEGVWIESTTLTADQIRVLAAQNASLATLKSDANNLQ